MILLDWLEKSSDVFAVIGPDRCLIEFHSFHCVDDDSHYES